MELNNFATAFLIINALLLLLLPRRWALLPLLLSVCYMTKAQGILVGPFHFTVIRLMVFAGFLRVFIRGDRLNRSLNSMDTLILFWACWILISSFFHTDIMAALVYRLGIIYDVIGIYFLICIFCHSIDDLIQINRIIAFILIPISFEMLYERLTAYNIFSMLGGVSEIPYIRDGQIRAQGPFAHAILAGVVGAVCLPMTISLWKLNTKLAFSGTIACVMMVYASSSSGPVLGALMAIFALYAWKFSDKTKMIFYFAILGYIMLDAIMKDPAYYLMARIDITGGSTGWHRARLIESSIEHLSEWWLAGTDYTRHWMPTGVSWNPNHTDITNHYIQMGVWSGLPVVALFIAQVLRGFSYVGATVRQLKETTTDLLIPLTVWALGASLFAHVMNCISVSYFDQSYVFLYINLACISSVCSKLEGFAYTNIILNDTTIESYV